jgi:hypothetical protein
VTPIYFEVTSQTAQGRGLPKPRMLRARRILKFLLPSVVGGLVIFILVLVLGALGLIVLFFLLLLTCATFIAEYRHLRNNRRELMLVGGLAKAYRLRS